MHGFFRVEETGWPKLDPLFAGRYPRASGTRPVVMYASTFTESITSARVVNVSTSATTKSSSATVNLGARVGSM